MKRCVRSCIYAFLGFVFAFSPLFGQTGTEEEALEYFVLEEVMLRGADDPTLRSALAIPQPKLILEATEDGDTRIKARVGFEIAKKAILDLEVISPRDKTTKRATLATEDGLPNASTADLGFSWVFRRPDPAALKATYGNWKPPVQPSESAAGSSQESRMEAYTAEKPADRMTAVKAAGGQENYWSMARYFRSVMSGTGGGSEVAAAGVQESKIKRPIFVTARAKAGREEFSFVDPETLKEADPVSHLSHSFSASVGTYLPGSFYSSLTYRQGSAFSASDSAEICKPYQVDDETPGPPGSIECQALTLGPPKDKTTQGLEVEFRRLFKSLGVGLRVVRNLEENITAIELPLYVLQKLGTSEMELNGGIAIKWRSDTDDYAVSAFIGPALSTVFRLGRNN